MACVFDEWRSSTNPCAGGLIWFLKDLRPGAGWGIIDSDNRPKAAYYALRRAWSPTRLALLDRGLDGLVLELHNDGSLPVNAEVEVRCFDGHGVVTAQGRVHLTAPARGSALANIEGVLGHFADPTYSYRFGPRRHRAVAAVATLDGSEESIYSVYWAEPSADVPVATVDVQEDPRSPRYAVRFEADSLVREARIEHAGWRPDDNYFDLVPGVPKLVTGPLLTDAGTGYLEAQALRGSVQLPPRDRGA
jgi:beta-mannosidase